MKFTDYIKKLIRNYLMIFAIILICSTILREIFSQNKYFELNEIYICMICSLISVLPGLIFYSSKQISEKKTKFRIIIHFVVLEAVLLTWANVTGLITGIENTILSGFEIAAVYMIIKFLSRVEDRKVADSINEKLRAMRNESSHEQDEE
ncbi:MAG: DUF3021 family protein [Clostridiaceae bacterium]